MLFENKLESEIYAPWREYFINYRRLKKLLKEGVILKNNWTDQDEQAFVSALDEELERVYTFQLNEFDELNETLDQLQLETESSPNSFDVGKFSSKLDDTLAKAQELDHFQRLNYTGFVKIVKKHDRIHPQFLVKPLLNVRLKSLPFHSEDYSPLLYKISALFQFLRENYDIDQSLSKLSSFNDDTQQQEYQSFKFWIHPDNLMEVKTTILRHLPVLIYDNKKQISYYDDDADDEESNDPTINCLYFDNNNFDLYNNKLVKNQNSSTLRIKWIGKLSEKPKITIEKKNFDATSDNFNIDEKLTVKEKYLDSFVKGKFDPGKIAQKMKKRGDDDEVIADYTDNVNKLSQFIKDNNLQPCMRTVYKRTAFQIPGDDKVRVVIDSDLMFIREDSFDTERPIRDPSKWHRTDIDSKIVNPYSLLRKGEFSKFPYSVMEIKVRSNRKKRYVWIDDLISSHLVKEIPNFSKFIQGVASLFLEDEKLENIPLWFNEMETSIKVDPQQAFIDSKKRLEKIQNDEENLSKFKSMLSKGDTFQPRSKSFSGSVFNRQFDSSPRNSPSKSSTIEGSQNLSQLDLEENRNVTDLDDDQSSDESEDYHDRPAPFSKLLKIPDTFSKLLDVDSEDEEVELPAGVTKPSSYIKNAGPLRIEPKVWLANERTINRWLHVTLLLSSLTVFIYSSVLKSHSIGLSKTLAYIYFGLTVFSCLWGYFIFLRRREIIMERSGKHLDNIIGPLIISLGLIIGLVINFVYGWRRIAQNSEFTTSGLTDSFYEHNPMHKSIHEFVFRLVGADKYI
ncbi:uncharacterized protein PRCAT00001669001 [Priceomyces carsonii]|uniref:uncharacterized protein n=1 Tax=Priceomyces carsonii TaxID=28549 RepID=UPI002ED97A83|nr:unnamed protein product [Priceomyces carsonii]